jgi:hypothetical protein
VSAAEPETASRISPSSSMLRRNLIVRAHGRHVITRSLRSGSIARRESRYVV